MFYIKQTSVLLFSLMISFSGYSISVDSNRVERDVQKSISAKVVGDKIYFNLTMLNESVPGVYSLVKTFQDGTSESVGIKEVAVNTIGQPLLYSFVDENKSDELVSYDLIRISLEAETVETWQYCPKEDRICDCILFSLND